MLIENISRLVGRLGSGVRVSVSFKIFSRGYSPEGIARQVSRGFVCNFVTVFASNIAGNSCMKLSALIGNESGIETLNSSGGITLQ